MSPYCKIRGYLPPVWEITFFFQVQGSGTQVEGSGTRLKDVEFLTQVEYTLIFNFGGMYELISSVKYDIKNPQT